MNVFKLALKVAARHWNYLLIYMVALGAMSLLGSGAIEVAPHGEFKADSPKVAVIDRDGTDASAALAAFALKDAEEVHVDDSTFGLQDASAKDLASYVLIIPEGFRHMPCSRRRRSSLPWDCRRCGAARCGDAWCWAPCQAGAMACRWGWRARCSRWPSGP